MSKTLKPRLSNGRRVIVETGTSATPGLGMHEPAIDTGPKGEALPTRAARSLAALIVLFVTMLALVYVALAATVLVVMRVDSHNVAVLRGAFPVGQAPTGAYVYVSSAPVDYSFLGKVDEAVLGVPAGSVVRIVAGPTGTVSTNTEGRIVADGTETAYHGEVRTGPLSREYVAICVSGACEEGAAVLVGQHNVIGEVKGYLSLTGITQPTMPGTD